MNKCNNCKNPLPIGLKYCPYCGFEQLKHGLQKNVVIAIFALLLISLSLFWFSQQEISLFSASTPTPINSPNHTLTPTPNKNVLGTVSSPTITETPMPNATFTPTLSPTITSTPDLGSTRVSAVDGMVMVFVPEGNFWMGRNDGDTDERPMRQVFLDAYWIDQTEVTNRMYRACVNDGGCTQPEESISGYDNYPVTYVSWDQARAYCTWAGRRLPTEAQWEKAARGPDGYLYPWGNQYPTGNKMNFADKNFDESHADKTVDDGYADRAPVGSYPQGASVYGVLDLAGNVWEFVADLYGEGYYQAGPAENPTGPSSGNQHVIRGGGFDNKPTIANAVNRGYTNPAVVGYELGFRCAYYD
jgi:eukaryotic-like serine/threonine-protein kinase